MKSKITTFNNMYPMSCWSICIAYCNILLYGCAMNYEEKESPLETSFPVSDAVFLCLWTLVQQSIASLGQSNPRPLGLCPPHLETENGLTVGLTAPAYLNMLGNSHTMCLWETNPLRFAGLKMSWHLSTQKLSVLHLHPLLKGTIQFGNCCSLGGKVDTSESGGRLTPLDEDWRWIMRDWVGQSWREMKMASGS